MRLGYALTSFCAAALLVPGLATAGTISDWSKADLVVGDKDFHLVSFSAKNGATNLTSLFGSTPVTASNIVGGVYTLTLGDGRSAIVKAGPWTGELVYTVKITNPLFFFHDAAIDSTAIGKSSLITEKITGAFTGSPLTLSSINGSAEDALIDHGVQLDKAVLLTIDEKFNISSLSAITSVQNSFIQTSIPEPGSLAVWAVGLTGIVGYNWLKRRKAKATAV